MIGEVAWADEWLEIWNTTNADLSLAGYKLRGAASTDIVFASTSTIPAYGTYIVSNYIDTDTKSTLAVPAQLVTTAVSLSNSALKIELIAPDGSVIDTAGNSGTPPAGSSLPTKTSMIRALDGTWISATSSKNLDPGTSDLATPGICDGCILPITIATVPDEPAPITEPTPTPEPIPEPEPIVEVIETVIETPPPEPLVGTSGTEQIISTSTIELPIQTEQPVVATTTTPIIQESTPTIAPIELRLNAIFPAPSSGHEYIDIDAASAVNPSQAIGWSLKDGSSTIFRFQDSTLINVTVDGAIWRITLASAHLNNGGDSVELIRPDGSVAERMTYPSTAKDKSWIKNTDGTAWIIDPPNPTPASVLIPSPTPVATPIVHPPTIEIPISISSSSTSNGVPAGGGASAFGNSLTSQTIVPKVRTPTGPAGTTKKKTTSPAPKSVKLKATTKKATTKKITPPPPLVTLAMLPSLDSEIRVSLEGTVGAKPGILGKNQGTLHTDDGRGLLVHGTNKQVSPAFGTHIRVTGTLTMNDDGLYLRMLTKDTWTLADGGKKINTRVVDLIAPSQEDAWSFIQVTGSVTAVTASKIEMELDGVPISIRIKPAAGYRTSRVTKGDTLRISGVVDTRGEEPILYPRAAEDIEIRKHAKLAQVTGPVPVGLPGWTPFGAAGLTVALTQGYKRLRRYGKEREWKRLAAEASADGPAPSALA